MQYAVHGGSCCGYGHIYGFDRATIADLDRCISMHAASARGDNRVLEAILSQRQVAPPRDSREILAEVIEAGGWPAILAQKGFRLAAQWINSNSGRRCYQFLKIENLLTDDEGYSPPFNWEGPVVSIQNPPPIEIRVEARPQVGWRVRRRGSPLLGTVEAVTDDTISVRWDGDRRLRNYGDFSRLERVVEVPPMPDGGLVDAPVDFNRPLYARLLRTGRVVRAFSTREGLARLNERDLGENFREGRNWDLRRDCLYVQRTGLFQGGNHVRLFNGPPHNEIIPVQVAQAVAAPEVRFTEFYASLRVGRRGPFETLGQAREAYPRCRSFESRAILSDGTSQWSRADA